MELSKLDKDRDSWLKSITIYPNIMFNFMYLQTKHIYCDIAIDGDKYYGFINDDEVCSSNSYEDTLVLLNDEAKKLYATKD